MLHLEILDKKRQDILHIFSKISKDFYLAGGTALALQIGHRDSVDFDFFTEKEFDTEKLYLTLAELFKDYSLVKTYTEKNTLYIIVGETVKISFITYKYPLIENYIETQYFNMASIIDIACMKCSAITSRQSIKDYIDIYFILKKHDIKKILSVVDVKFNFELDRNLVLKSLVYFDDIDEEPIMYKNNQDVSFDEIKRSLVKMTLK